MRHTAKTETCWLWTGATLRGYGRVKFAGRIYIAHRASYEAFKGPIPAGLVIDHLCRQPGCVNPDHLEAVTLTENIRRGVSKAAQWGSSDFCQRGHRFDNENTIIQRGYRLCRACRDLRNRARYARTVIRIEAS